MFSNQATMTYHLPHDHPIFLLHKALVPLLIRTASLA